LRPAGPRAILSGTVPDFSKLTEAQWRLLRQRMEEIAEGNTRSRLQLNPVEVAEYMLMLMDRIDDLERKLSA
jgi:DnaJ-domain-containing protein 1